MESNWDFLWYIYIDIRDGIDNCNCWAKGE